MVDYSGQEPALIENVDHEIDLLGLKPANLMYVAWGFMAGLFLSGPIPAIVMAALLIFLLRKISAREKEGRPVTFEPIVSKVIRKVPFQIGTTVFDYLAAIEHPQSFYRE